MPIAYRGGKGSRTTKRGSYYNTRTPPKLGFPIHGPHNLELFLGGNSLDVVQESDYLEQSKHAQGSHVLAGPEGLEPHKRHRHATDEAYNVERAVGCKRGECHRISLYCLLRKARSLSYFLHYYRKVYCILAVGQPQNKDNRSQMCV